MTADLTKGSPLKQILFFSIPFLIGNLFQQFYNIADMVIVGRTLDSYAYAAVGATSSLVWFASGAIQSLTAGFSTITARYFGADDEEGVKKSFAASIKLAGVISVALAVLCTVLHIRSSSCCARPRISSTALTDISYGSLSVSL